jgi:hypothetical protein
MKVIDLRCSRSHTFEGWFASEHDFVMQTERGLVLCPVCGDTTLQKLLSAPRLNLGAEASRPLASASDTPCAQATESTSTGALLEIAKHIVSNTTDVGNCFAEEARKMHYGEVPERAIRGRATLPETKALLEEGIEVLPVYLPESLKGTLQ